MNSYNINTAISSFEVAYGKIEYEVFDSNGNKKEKGEQKVDSFVRNYWYNFFASSVRTIYNSQNSSQFYLLPSVESRLNYYSLDNTLILVQTTSIPLSISTYSASCNSLPNQYAGIIVGSSNASVSYNDTNLNSLISFGNNAGEIYSYHTNVAYIPSTGECVAKREFFNKNIESSSFSINEIGLSVTSTNRDWANSTNLISLYVRDVLNEPITLEQGDRATISYSFKLPNKSKNFNNVFLYSRMFIRKFLFNDFAIVTDIEGQLVTFDKARFHRQLDIESPYGESNIGLIVGSSSNAININDFSLGSRITHGSNIDQLIYYGMVPSPLYEDNTNGTAYFYVSRVFGNKTNANVEINEAAIYLMADEDQVGPFFMLDRYVFDDTINVRPNENVELLWNYSYALTPSNQIPIPVSNVNSYNINLVDNGTYMASFYATNADYAAQLSENGNYMALFNTTNTGYQVELSENGTYMASLLALDDSYSVNVVENGTYMLSNVYSSNTEYSAELSANGTYMISNLTANVV
jgi:hypothetical protein